jgi:hypothetical protein
MTDTVARDREGRGDETGRVTRDWDARATVTSRTRETSTVTLAQPEVAILEDGIFSDWRLVFGVPRTV